ncbi:TIR domain-containing protein [Novosphingobium sp.]|uniref:TIR domain-containing protein n=1 Tax=Novosphingobium sp. TaxID=1874826 RepID=UPI003703FB35
MAPAVPVRYRAFISYSHSDAGFASWLHRKLESWRLPDKTRLTPIFIDRAELAAGSDLSEQVRAALAASAALVVVSSPSAKASRWVGQEIALFRALHPDSPVLAALIEGAPEAAFPDALVQLDDRTIEPLAADFRNGHDGKRLGLIKIIAGLTAQPLDRLIQRDAQNRQRRVMAVTAGALLLSLILSASLIFALRARAEAERQRSEAEGLVEFMLTDLRDKLKGVGNLDVMDAVNDRAMRYYADGGSLDGLGPDSLTRRARVIEAMGIEDENRGKLANAFAKYTELHRVTENLLAADPANPQRILAHARSENRLALIEVTQGNEKAALPRFLNAKALLDSAWQIAGSADWRALDSLVTGNLCAITLEAGGDPNRALEFCRRAVELAKAEAGKADNPNALYDLAFHYLWMADAADAIGNRSLARESRRLGLKTSERLIALSPHNWLWLEQHAEVTLDLARAARADGDTHSARTLSAIGAADAQRLVRHDPANSYWRNLQAQCLTFRKEILQ